MSKVVIIGGGAAGMAAAIGAAECGHDVSVYEKNEKLGKKIYITGKGRCNLTNGCDTEDLFRNMVSNGSSSTVPSMDSQTLISWILWRQTAAR